MGNVIETFGGILVLAALGFFLFYLTSLGSGGSEDPYRQLQRIYSNRQLNRRDVRERILHQIGSPECPDGTYSPRQNWLWGKYHELEREGNELTEQEQNHLVEVRGYLPDEIADIIEGIK